MLPQVDLTVVPRDRTRKGIVKELRQNGMVPANIYGPGKPNMTCAFSEKEVRKIFKKGWGSNLILNLQSESKDLNGKKVVLKVVERDSVNWQLIHADLYELQMDRPLVLDVSLNFVGTPEGVKQDGGVFQVIRRTLKVRALPKDLPESIEVDVNDLKFGHSIHVRDVKVAPNVTLLDDGKYTIAGVVAAAKEEEVVVATAAVGEGAAAATGTGAAAAPAAAGTEAAGKGKEAAAPAKGKD